MEFLKDFAEVRLFFSGRFNRLGRPISGKLCDKDGCLYFDAEYVGYGRRRVSDGSGLYETLMVFRRVDDGQILRPEAWQWRSWVRGEGLIAVHEESLKDKIAAGFPPRYWEFELGDFVFSGWGRHDGSVVVRCDEDSAFRLHADLSFILFSEGGDDFSLSSCRGREAVMGTAALLSLVNEHWDHIKSVFECLHESGTCDGNSNSYGIEFSRG